VTAPALPETWEAALRVRAEQPDLVPICGGTDLMIEFNFGRRRPPGLLDLTRVAELAQWQRNGTEVRIGAAVPFSRIIDELGDAVPGLALAARTVGSPQIRNRGTLGGNLGTASPAGDALPPLVAARARVEVESVRGRRVVPVAEFFDGPKRSVLAADELIRAVVVPVADGPQQFAKVGTRNAMVIAVCSFAFALHPTSRSVAGCIGSAGPTVLPTSPADEELAGALDRAGQWESRQELDPALVERYAARAGELAQPIDDVRGTAAYRRHAVSVLARRTLTWAWAQYRGGNG
jgi:CO/xanthine dehydrogenase FAD-binding subunit